MIAIPIQSAKGDGSTLQSQRDWPSDHFELLWKEVADATPQGTLTANEIAQLPVITEPQWGEILECAWVKLTGKLEQSTPMGAIHPEGQEWFVRTDAGDPVAVYVMHATQIVPGSIVSILGRSVGTIQLPDRQGVLREYPALIGCRIDPSALRFIHSTAQVSSGVLPSGLFAILAVVVLVGAWIGVRVMSKRASIKGASRIHAVADRAREGSIASSSQQDGR